jgi:hypothetical protein
MPSGDSKLGPLGGLLVIGVFILAGVLAAMVYVPPYSANREVKTALVDMLAAEPTTASNEALLQALNSRLYSTKTSRFWVEDDGQHTGYDLQLTPEQVTFTHDGNRQVSADVTNTQEMLVPLVNRRQVLSFTLHVDGPAK